VPYRASIVSASCTRPGKKPSNVIDCASSTTTSTRDKTKYSEGDQQRQPQGGHDKHESIDPYRHIRNQPSVSDEDDTEKKAGGQAYNKRQNRNDPRW